MRQIAYTNLERINDNQVLEKQIFSFDEYDLERKKSLENVVTVLAALKDAIKARREIFFVKGDNNLYYNETWNIYENSLPDLFLDRMTHLESKERKTYSELFRLIKGGIKSKIEVVGKKSIYIQDILNNLDEITSLEFKGVIYSRECKVANMKFNEYRHTMAFDKIQSEYQEDWSKRINMIDDIIRKIDSLYEFAILNKGKGCKIGPAQETKVDIA